MYIYICIYTYINTHCNILHVVIYAYCKFVYAFSYFHFIYSCICIDTCMKNIAIFGHESKYTYL